MYQREELPGIVIAEVEKIRLNQKEMGTSIYQYIQNVICQILPDNLVKVQDMVITV